MVMTASKQMLAQLASDHHQDSLYAQVNTTIKRQRLQRSLYRYKRNYRTTTVTTASTHMETQLSYDHGHDGF
jgi:hypothetical protein